MKREFSNSELSEKSIALTSIMCVCFELYADCSHVDGANQTLSIRNLLSLDNFTRDTRVVISFNFGT